MEFLACLLVLGLILMSGSSAASDLCGDYRQAHDYLNPAHRERLLRVVEEFHFTEDIKMLRRGRGAALGADLSYTLRHFPNHHEALYAMVRYAVREGTEKPPHSDFTMDCWFTRAKTINRNDDVVWLIEGIYHQRKGRNQDAVASLTQALALNEWNAETHYNLGITLFRLGEYQQALERAKDAYSLGYPLPGLRRMLEAAGHWED
ncbi:tetratricopeptide repeat protein [Ectothiorhodospira haloalkaliphila]|uniref:tetratricopeptide repeat protein n=1 Tax=Ectothiorhodospira haloalkaliphila TaxID=421628 RepID=UPI001EE7D6D0|nr:tetratricopeptide repeat protein [Ectothiorhodospira haloalkaliphila]MCG5524333.1 tetratricopeptide repeat protein [Ectothiorhodospira haloalkaliphila]